MVTTLNETGRSDILRAIREGELSPLAVYESFRVNELHRLPLGKELMPLKETMTAWNEASEVGRQRKADNKSAIKRLSAKGTTVASLPDALNQVRQDLVREKHPAQFNRIRATALAFLRDTVKRSHRLYGEVRDVALLKEKKAPERNPQTWEQICWASSSMDSKRDNAHFWAMALTGMGPKECFIDGFKVLPDRVVIFGEKRKSRTRIVPRLIAYWGALPPADVAPAREMRRFGERLYEQTGIHSYDLRRTYANWLEAAGVPRTRRKLYLGHAKSDVTDIYEQHEVEQFLADDAAKIEAFFGQAPITTHITRPRRRKA